MFFGHWFLYTFSEDVINDYNVQPLNWWVLKDRSDVFLSFIPMCFGTCFVFEKFPGNKWTNSKRNVYQIELNLTAYYRKTPNAITLKDWAIFLSCVKKSQSSQSRIGMEAPKELRLFSASCPNITRKWPSFSSWVVIRTTGLISQRKRRKAHLFKETSLLSLPLLSH